MTDRPRLRLALLALAVGGAFAVCATFVPRSPEELRLAVGGGGLVAAAVLVVAWTVLTPALVSGTLLAAAGGLLLGPVLGFAASSAGALTGGVAAFLIARQGGAGSLRAVSSPRVVALTDRLRRNGFTAVLMARLAPGVPSTGLNYAAGIAGVRLRHFAPAIALGGTPRVLAYTSLGASGGDLTSPEGILAAALIGGLFAVAVAALLIRRRVRRAQPA